MSETIDIFDLNKSILEYIIHIEITFKINVSYIISHREKEERERE